MSRSATIMRSTAHAGGLELRFRGQWLKGDGFELGQRVNVEQLPNGGIAVTPDAFDQIRHLLKQRAERGSV